MTLPQFAVWATMEAIAGKEDDARTFLVEAGRRQLDEPGTTRFVAMDMGDRKFAIFSTFTDEAALTAHISGPVAAWVEASRPDLFVGPYQITRSNVFAMKDRGELLTAGA